MSLFDSASLIVTPSGYKEDKLYAIKPSDGSGDLVVTRATTATRVNSEGLIETASLLGDELVTNGDFATDTNWTKGASWSISGGTANYDDVNNNSILEQTLTLTSGVTYKITFNVVSGSNARFDLANQGGNSLIGGTRTFPIGFNTVYTNGLSATSLRIYGVTSGTAFSIDNLSIKEVITNNVPRLDYTNSTCPSILVEPQRTNLFTYSEQFDNGAWTKTRTTITANSIISPDGTLTADKISDTIATSTNHIIQFSQPYTSGVSYTKSCFVKNDDIGFFFIQFRANAFGVEKGVYFDIENGNISYQDSGIIAKIEDYGNGWYRCQATATATNTVASTLVGINFGISVNGSNQVYTSTTIKSLYIWGAQLEVGSYATSYIPTIASTVTRNADVISKTGISSLIGTEFTLFLDAYETTGGNSSRYIILKGTGGTYANALLLESTTNNRIALTVLNGSSATVFGLLSGTLTNGQRFKLAVRCKNNDFAFYVNGVLIGSQASGTVPTTSNLYLGYYSDYADNYNKINSAIIWKTGLSNSELAQLTSL